jgi:hypothetical protein
MASRNQNPDSGGDVTEYTGDIETYGAAKSPNVSFPSSTRAEILFINGMNNSPQSHVVAARTLATITGQKVQGIYNQTGLNGKENIPNAIIDALQCLHDWSLPVGRMRGSRPFPREIKRLVARFKSVEVARYYVGRITLAFNRAAVTLYDRLYKNAKSGTRSVIVCHSQGNLISSNALWVLKSVREPSDMGSIRLLGLASPTASWPPNREGGLTFSLYRDDRDGVTLFSIPWIGNQPSTTTGPKTKESTHRVGLYFAREDFQRDLAAALRG